jgi:hypothetical protein
MRYANVGIMRYANVGIVKGGRWETTSLIEVLRGYVQTDHYA